MLAGKNYYALVAQALNAAGGAGAGVELEISAGHFDRKGNFTSDIGLDSYNEIVVALRGRYPSEGVVSYIVKSLPVKDDPNKQIRLFYASPTDIKPYKTEIKERRKILDLNELSLRARLSIETPVTIPEFTEFRPERSSEKYDTSKATVRSINRESFLVAGKDGNKFRFDLSMVTTDGKITYELEIELLRISNDDFVDAVTLMRQLYVSLPIPPALTEARNLHKTDLVSGGIINNSETGYVVAVKADGLRSVLTIHEGTAWLALPKTLHKREMLTSNLKVKNCIIEVEDVPLNRRYGGAPTVAHWLLAYDLLSSKDKPYIGRHQELVEILGNIPIVWSNAVVQVKPIHLLTEHNFFEVMTAISNTDVRYSYHTDGFIFTPADLSYEESTSAPVMVPVRGPIRGVERKGGRHLTTTPDICKWKPEITVDIGVARISGPADAGIGGYRFWSSIGEGKQADVPLSMRGRFDLASMDKVLGSNAEAIVEVYLDRTNNLYTAKQLRPDKQYPNSLKVVEDNLMLIEDPIYIETLRGDDTVLLRRYHNRIKGDIFYGMSLPGDVVILDIGSGKGQNTRFWVRSEIRHVYAVEPNAKHLPELRRRIIAAGLADKVTIIEALGQDTDRIKAAIGDGPLPNVGSMMLSMSFFWEHDGVLDGLARTFRECLTKDAPIYFLTIDGDAVTQVMDDMDRGRQGDEVTIFQTQTLLLKVKNGDVTVAIRGSHVGDRASSENPIFRPERSSDDDIGEEGGQHEWLVKLGALIKRLPNYRVRRTYRADTELLLPVDQKQFSSLYTYGVLAPPGVPGAANIYIPPPRIKAMLPVPAPRVQPQIQARITVPGTVTMVPGAVTMVPPAVTAIPPAVTVIPPTIPAIPAIPVVRLPTVCQLPIVARNASIVNIQVHNLVVGAREAIIAPRGYIGNVFREGVIGDGSCLVHAILQTFDQNYISLQLKDKYAYAAKIRRDIANLLGTSIDQRLADLLDIDLTELKQLYPYDNIYRSLDITKLETLGNDACLPFEVSLKSLQMYWNSDNWLGDESLQIISRLYQINIIIVQVRSQSTEFLAHYSPYGADPESSKDYPYVVIAMSEERNHYEAIKLDDIAVFPWDHSLITALFSRSK